MHRDIHPVMARHRCRDAGYRGHVRYVAPRVEASRIVMSLAFFSIGGANGLRHGLKYHGRVPALAVLELRIFYTTMNKHIRANPTAGMFTVDR